jgi:hypothetical protein
MKTKITDIRERLCDGADLVVDFATLGEYGYQRRDPECRPEPCVPGRVHAQLGSGEQTTALQRRAARLERFAA